MKNILIRFSILQATVAIAFFMCGCTASMHVINEGSKLYPANSPERIMVVSQRAIVNKDYTEMGYVSVNITNATGGDELKEAVKEEAASIGADAIVDFRIFGATAGGIAVKFK